MCHTKIMLSLLCRGQIRHGYAHKGYVGYSNTGIGNCWAFNEDSKYSFNKAMLGHGEHGRFSQISWA